MQTSLETLGQLERRLTTSVPVAADRRRNPAAARAPRQDRQGAGIPSRQGAAQDGRAAIRPAGALRRHLRCGQEQLQRRGARAEPARRRLSADRAQEQRPPRPTRSSSRRCSRSIRRSRSATFRRHASSGRRPMSAPDDIDRTIDVLRQQRTRYEPVAPRRGGRRPRDRRLHRHDRRRRVPRRAGERTSRSRSAKAGCCRSSKRRSPG